MSMQAQVYLGPYLWIPTENPNEGAARLCYAVEGVNCYTLIPNVSYPGGRSSSECGSYDKSETEISFGDREGEIIAFRAGFAAEIDVVMAAEPQSEIRWGLLLWHM